MIITICGSSAFAKEKVECRDRLKALGHMVIMNPLYERIARGEVSDEGQLQKSEYIRWYYQQIVQSDAILILNFNKKGVAGYIGGNSLMEIGFAHVHDKKIYLLYPVPDLPYADEIRAMYTEILDGDIFRIPLAI